MEFGVLSESDFSVAELVENEEESKESETEESKESELDCIEVMQWVAISFKGFESHWSATEHTVRSLIREIPSPPPDKFS